MGNKKIEYVSSLPQHKKATFFYLITYLLTFNLLIFLSICLLSALKLLNLHLLIFNMFFNLFIAIMTVILLITFTKAVRNKITVFNIFHCLVFIILKQRSLVFDVMFKQLLKLFSLSILLNKKLLFLMQLHLQEGD